MNMSDVTLYAVFFHPAALEALGDPIKPYLSEGPYGPHVVCREIDSGGAFFEMTLEGRDSAGQQIEVELMIPTVMVRMVISTHSDEAFGFHHDKDAAPKSSAPRKSGSASPSPQPGPQSTEAQALPAAARRTNPPTKS
jgi:hypothetical protein